MIGMRPSPVTLHLLTLASVLTHSDNSGHTVLAVALTQMLGYASHFVCTQPFYVDQKQLNLFILVLA
jgi:hypothetical protein